jgi:hypothetical protein
MARSWLVLWLLSHSKDYPMGTHLHGYGTQEKLKEGSKGGSGGPS